MTGRILVVDDILPNVKLLEAKLTAEYFEVLTARDGPAALDLAVAEAPDLVLLDVMMPGMDGFEVCRRLKADSRTRHIPVVMVTALSEVSDRVRGLEAGADDFLSKPVNDLALFARVRSLVRLKLTMDELRLRQATFGEDALPEPIDFGAEDTSGADILVVESRDTTSAKIVDCLRQAAYNAVPVMSVADARRAVEEHCYDLIIVSLDIDGEDGLRLCSQLRSLEQTRQVPILLVLDEMDLLKLAKGLDLGVTDYLVKPFDRNELLARTRTQIRRRRYHDQLREMLQHTVALAYTDALTGVYNRRYMNSYLDQKIMEIAETAKPVSLILFDIDHFKRVNDDHGHAAGDEVLKALTGRVRNGLRDLDLVARYGGEEFVVIMPGTDNDIACKVAERLRGMIADSPISISTEPGALPVTISIGVATTSDPMEEAASLLRRADEALYEAKDAGRNRVVVSDTLPSEASEALALAKA